MPGLGFRHAVPSVGCKSLYDWWGFWIPRVSGGAKNSRPSTHDSVFNRSSPIHSVAGFRVFGCLPVCQCPAGWFSASDGVFGSLAGLKGRSEAVLVSRLHEIGPEGGPDRVLLSRDVIARTAQAEDEEVQLIFEYI